jgi:hypothetical protein
LREKTRPCNDQKRQPGVVVRMIYLVCSRGKNTSKYLKFTNENSLFAINISMGSLVNDLISQEVTDPKGNSKQSSDLPKARKTTLLSIL